MIGSSKAAARKGRLRKALFEEPMRLMRETWTPKGRSGMISEDQHDV
ncbi:hypothetical protein KP509_18G018700 [Ceratopteris richardii]|uniref:Uncharacterized protein n=1 Tax=Ceratopteris richardii TaxID=49495 RepID=A0A8T2SN15_CERRI|nr:hypothetical protein KP509_18G018700 [Ceratopteris richardii]